MPVFAQTSMDITVDTLGLQGFANEANLEVSADELEATTFASGGWRIKTAGLAQGMFSVSGFQDYVATGVDPSFPLSGLGGVDVWTVGPFTGTQVAGDPAFMGQGPLTSYNPLAGAVGDLAKFAFGFAGTGQTVRGRYLHPSAARVSTAFGSVITLTPPTAAQSLYATFHVLSVTGSGSIVFTVQTDDAVGMGTPTTRISSTSFTGVGRQFTSLAGSLSGETHMRTGWTISGFTSVTFVVAAGVL